MAVWTSSCDQIRPNCELYKVFFLQPTHTASVSAVLDFDSAHDLSQPHQVTRLMGGTKTDWPLRYAASDPLHIANGRGSISLIHGTLDTDVPISQAQSYIARSGNPNLTLEVMPTTGHFWMLPADNQAATYWPQLVNSITNALARL